MENIFTIDSSSLPDGTHVVSFRGSEGLSTLYQFDLALMVSDSNFDGEGVIGTMATLRIERGKDADPVLIHGLVAAIEHVYEAGGRAVFQATLVPRVFPLTQSQHSRVFVDQSVPEIVEAVLSANGLSGDDYQLKLQESYPKMEHVGQYRESDFAFIARLLEREGVYFFFEQGDSATKLIITDSASFHQPLGDAVRFFAGSTGDTGASESLSFFASRMQSLAQRVSIADYDYNNPDLSLAGEAEVGDGSVVMHIHGENFADKANADRLARMRGEELSCRRKVFRGHGRVMTLRPGYCFDLEEHPRAGYNAKYLTTRLEHFGNQSAAHPEIKEALDVEFDDEYRVDVVAIPADAQYRAPRRTHKPRIFGMENAVVDGPAESEYAQIDDHGRYKVKLLFDESDLKDGGGSTWVRMLQPHGGTKEGFHFPLRRGTEVMIAFQGGDPDRPFIAGVLPNAQKGSPVVAENHTRNVIQSGGENLIELEDKAGAQHVFISTPTEGTFIHMGGAREGQHLFINTKGMGHLVVGGQWWHVNQGAVLEQYADDHTTIITGDRNQSVSGNFIAEHGVNHELKVGCEQHVNIGVNQATKVGVNQITEVGAIQATKVGALQTTEIGGNRDITIGGSGTVTATGDLSYTATNVTVTSTSDVKFKILGHKVEIKSANETSITGGLTNSIYGGMKNSLFGGVSNSASMGVSNSIHLGPKNSLHVGPAISLSASLSLTVAAAASLSLTTGVKAAFDSTIDLRASPIEVVDSKAWVRKGLITAFQSALYIIA